MDDIQKPGPTTFYCQCSCITLGKEFIIIYEYIETWPMVNVPQKFTKVTLEGNYQN